MPYMFLVLQAMELLLSATPCLADREREPLEQGNVITRARTNRVCASGLIAVGAAAAHSLRTSPDRSHRAGKSGTEEMLIIGSGRRPACSSRPCPDRMRSELVRINLDDRQGAIDFVRKCDRNWRV